MKTSYKVQTKDMDRVLEKIRSQYKIIAPKKFYQSGNGEQKYSVRYGEISHIDELVYDEPSDFSPKEAIYPVMQTILHFSDDGCVEAALRDERKLLIFLRACDLNGISRLDTIFLKNGNHEDIYYKRLREKARFAVIECETGWENCFCVSMGSNRTEGYDLAVKLEKNQICINVASTDFRDFFLDETSCDYEIKFIEKNQTEPEVPVITDRKMIKEISELEYWSQFDEKCISCGGCNTVCVSCSCFDTVDVIYDETSLDGERRRKWSSCMLDDFSKMAGGHNVRSSAGARTRFKTLHKIYDYAYRFKENHYMCVGCGRCSRRCPEKINFAEIINDLCEEVEKLKKRRDTE